jgi:hypothetical protein
VLDKPVPAAELTTSDGFNGDLRRISLVKDLPVLRPIQRFDQIAARPIFDIK